MSEAKWRRYARFAKPDVGADVDDEMEFHIQTIADRYVRAGHSPNEARTMAVQEFGDRRRAREECVDIDTTRLRDSSRDEWLGNIGKDVRHGARRLRKNPLFAIVTILTLAIGIGPNIAIFSIINSVLLRPLPYASPDRLVVVQETFPMPGGGSGFGSVSYDNYVDWKAQSRSFDFAISRYAGSANLVDVGEPQRLSVTSIGVDAFDILGVRPIAGRLFSAEDGRPESPPVVVLGEAFWRTRYNADRSVIGRKISLDGVEKTVIGIVPATVPFPNRTIALDVWQPLRFQVAPGTRGSHAFFVVGRLKPGVTVQAATTEMKQIAARLAEQYPQSQEKRSVVLTPYTEAIVGGVRQQLVVLLGAAGIVLLIACANAASLLLARATSRRREVAVLAALGASRLRVAQQFLIESLILATLGGGLGFLLSRVAERAIIAAAGTSLPRSTQIRFDARVAIFIAATIILTTVLFGLVPAVRATRADLQECLRGGRTETGARGMGVMRNALVVGQFALSLVLLAGAGLLLKTFAALVGTQTGMQTEHTLTMRIPFPYGSPKYPGTEEAINRFYEPVLARIRGLPGVRSAGMINLLPLQSTGNNGNFAIVGKTYASISEQPFAETRVVSPGYFATLGIPIISGRDASPDDRAATQQVVLINQQLATRFFAHEDPLGKSLQFGPPGPTNPPSMIVGVVGSVRQSRLDAPPEAETYFPSGQSGGSLSSMSLLVRTDGDPTLVTRAVVNAIHAVDPTQPVYSVQAMTDVVHASVASSKLYLGLLAAFAGIALALAVAGIYGVMSYAVNQRTREFGIRLALGSDTARVQRLVVWEGTRLALCGLAVGMPAAYLLTRLLRGVLYGVSPGDPSTLAAVALLLATVAVVASYLPSRRVTSVDPIVAMRAE